MKNVIPRFDYREQYRRIKAEILEAIDRVLESGSLILGPRVVSFEEKICRYLGVDGYAVGVGNGTDAIAIALRAMNIGAGDEVITVANTAVATVSAIRMAGATPVFCEVDAQTLLMDPGDVERRITGRTRAIIPVHLFGNAVEMMAIGEIARRRGLRVIEDCAQSLGTTLCGRQTGTFGQVGCFSFYPTKNLGAFGDGGMCFTQDPRLAIEMRRIRNYGLDRGASAERDGVNSRLDELQAAVLDVKLKYLPEYLRLRRRIAEIYLKHLPRACQVPRTTPGISHSYHLFVIQVPNRDEVITRMREQGIECGIHYPVPIHLMKPYQSPACPAGVLPVTESAAGRILSLSCYPELEEERVVEVCRALDRTLCELAKSTVRASEKECVTRS